MAMQRREFIGTAVVAGAVAASGLSSGVTIDPQADAAAGRHAAPFKLDYAPHFGMFRHSAGDDPVAQLEFMASRGFRSLEDNGMMGRSVEEQERIAHAMERLGMRMGVFVASMSTAFGNNGLASGKADTRDQFLADCNKAVEVAKRVRATWMTVVPGELNHRLEIEHQTANVIDALRRAAEVFEPHGLVMVLEPLNPWRDHPGMFLSKAAQAYLVCRGVNSPACKILFDIYHQQVTEGNLIQNINLFWNEIAYFQIGDHPGRCEPTTGEINYRNIFKHIHAKGFTGILGMEHGNSKGGKDGEEAVIAAYAQSDSW